LFDLQSDAYQDEICGDDEEIRIGIEAPGNPPGGPDGVLY
jgi:hypothetical protein